MLGLGSSTMQPAVPNFWNRRPLTGSRSNTAIASLFSPATYALKLSGLSAIAVGPSSPRPSLRHAGSSGVGSSSVQPNGFAS
jgi:hypothetical protein